MLVAEADIPKIVIRGKNTAGKHDNTQLGVKEDEIRHWNINYTSTQSLINMKSQPIALKCGYLLVFINRGENFVYLNWKHKSI